MHAKEKNNGNTILYTELYKKILYLCPRGEIYHDATYSYSFLAFGDTRANFQTTANQVCHGAYMIVS